VRLVLSLSKESVKSVVKLFISLCLCVLVANNFAVKYVG
jgi:hypothetical protein